MDTRITSTVKCEKAGDVVWFRRKRYLVASMTFGGVVLNYFLRANLSIAIVAMTSPTIIQEKNFTYVVPAEFDWTSFEKGFILSSFSWGYLLAPVGGILAAKFGAATVYGCGLVVVSVLTTLSPVLVRVDRNIFILGRIMEGVAEGFSKASILGIFLFWIPPRERSRLVGNVVGGAYFSMAIVYPFCGFVIKNFGWEWMFFVTGGLSLFFCFCWFILVRNAPEYDHFMTAAEQSFLAKEIRIPYRKNIPHPWKEIFMSKAIWALLNERFVEGWSQSFAMFCFPLFVKDLFAESVQNIALLSSLPNISSFVALVAGSFVFDCLRNHTKLQITNIHVGFITLGQVLSILMLIFIAISMHPTVIFICAVAFRFFYGIADVSYGVLPLDLAQNYATFVAGLSALSLTLAHVLNPILMGYIVVDHNFDNWKSYFMVIAMLNIWGGVIFFFLGSGQIQPWAVVKTEPELDQKGITGLHLSPCQSQNT